MNTHDARSRQRIRTSLLSIAASAALAASTACLAGTVPAPIGLKTETDPSFAAANVAARETLVLQQLQAIKRAQDFYNVSKNRYGTLDELVAAGGINRLPDGFGYNVTVTATEGGAGYVLNAVPQVYGPNGQRSFYMDQSGVIRAADHHGAPASASDPVTR
jgi:opacity protein-like surface antigen